MKGDKKITLTEKELPTHWYNIVADMTNKPLPPLNPVTKQAASKEDFLPIFAEELVNQEFSQERFIEIPEQVQDLASDSASQSLWTGKSPGYPGQDLFQKRKYQYGRIT